jgi:hypothetical protein
MYVLEKGLCKIFHFSVSLKTKYREYKKNRRDKLVSVIIHTYMEMSQGNCLCSYLKQTKMSFFFLLQNWRTGRQNKSCLEEVGTSGNREEFGKGIGG